VRIPRRNALPVAADGTTEVMLLTNPIPRHLSIVSWGANDRPAVSWRSASGPSESESRLREGPSIGLLKAAPTKDIVLGHVGETLDAWRTVIAEIIAEPITAGERASRVQAVSAQAGARIAVYVEAASREAVARAVESYRAETIVERPVRTSPTLDSELDRSAFMADVDAVSLIILNSVIDAVRDPSPFASSTEAILSLFHEYAGSLIANASAMPDGPVGVSQRSVDPKDELRPAVRLVASILAGRRHSSSDEERLKSIFRLLTELLGEDTSTPSASERSQVITLAMLSSLVDENPVGFIELVKRANEKLPADSKRFAWGETGHDPVSAQELLNAFKAMPGDQLLTLIASAVGGVNLDTAATDNTSVNSSMRSIAKTAVAELRSAPEGLLAQEIKKIVAPDVVAAIRSAFERFADMQAANDEDNFSGFQVEESELSGLEPEIPGARR
jgi:hypothetical protein